MNGQLFFVAAVGALLAYLKNRDAWQYDLPEIDAGGGIVDRARDVVEGLGVKLDKVFNFIAWANIRRVAPIVDSMRANPNVNAFLHVIRHRESSHGDAAYLMVQGSRVPFSAPPRIHPNMMRGTWEVPAGAYQFKYSTWAGVAKEMTLMDFTPINQDRAAIGYMAYLGALQNVLDGDFEIAIDKCNNRSGWTSLPGGPEELQTMETAKAVFKQYGGTLAGGG